jgi:general stress protein 26
MKKKDAFERSLELANKSEIAVIGSNGENGYPNIKAMLKMKNEGLKKIWFSTNTSSKRVAQFRKDPKVCVYFVDPLQFKGLMLVGDIGIHQDIKSRKLLWRQGFERYYPLGINDPDYCVLCFTAKWGNYYHKLENITFQIS